MSGSRETTYLEKIARMVWWATGQPEIQYEDEYRVLWLGYATLVLSRGTSTTNQDIHDVWTMWSIDHSIRKGASIHPSAIEFDELHEATQILDTPFRDAVHEVAMMLETQSIDNAFAVAIHTKVMKPCTG